MPLFYLGISAFIATITGYYYSIALTPFFLFSITSLLIVTGIFLFIRNQLSKFTLDLLLIILFTLSLFSFISTKQPILIYPNKQTPIRTFVTLKSDPVQTNYGFRFHATVSVQGKIYSVECQSFFYLGNVLKNDVIEVSGNLMGYDSIYSYKLFEPLFRAKWQNKIGYIQINEIFYRKYNHSRLKDEYVDVRDWIHLKIHRTINKKIDDDVAPLVEALLLGNYQSIDENILIGFRRTGLVHLLALSGLQIAFVWGLLEVVVSIFQVKFFTRQIVILIGLLVYRLLLPDVASVDRALLMAILFILSRFIGRPQNSLQIFGASLLIMSLLNPIGTVTPGFQLSYGGVLGLLIGNRLFQSLNTNFHSFQSILKFPLLSIFLSVSATLTTAPIVIYHFGYVSVASLLLNLIAIPISSILFTGTVFLIITSPLFVSNWIGYGTSVIGDLLFSIVKIEVPVMIYGTNSFLNAMFFVIVVFFIIWLSIKKKFRYVSVFALVGLSMLYFNGKYSTEKSSKKIANLYEYSDRKYLTVIRTESDLTKFIQLWLRYFPYDKCTILMLKETNTKNPFPERINVVNTTNLQNRSYLLFDENFYWKTLSIRTINDIKYVSGYLSLNNSAEFFTSKIDPTEIWKLGWIEKFPEGTRKKYLDTIVDTKSKWFFYRWNKEQ